MNIILRWARSLYRKAILKHLIAPEIVVLMDGGICSQMHQYLLGRFFAQKGYKVSYDLSFYRTWGTDLTHRFVRNFDLLKAFPYIEITKASDFKTPTLAVNSVTIRATADELNAIRFVRAIVDVSGFTSGNSAKVNANVVAYDADGNRVQVEIDPTTIEATVEREDTE